MTNILHLSDLHFGTENTSTVAVLISAINSISPDIIVISGDFTQRAKVKQFKAAQIFLKSLTCKNILLVPGNHDIPLHNLFIRFFLPFSRYKKYISADLNSYYCDDNIAILGINSATPFMVMDGLITKDQLQITKDFFAKIDPKIKRIVFMHHNMIKPEYHKVLANLEEVLHVLSKNNVSLILSGHLHDVCIEKIERDFIHYDMYTITAGTALSSRLRTQKNSFNLLVFNEEGAKLIVYELNASQYVIAKEMTLDLS